MKARYLSWLLNATLVALVCFGMLSPVAAQSAEDKARAAFRLGRAHYDNGDFQKAAKEFTKAYELSGKSQLLYNVYLAYRDANMAREAADSLRGYLEKTEDVPNRAQLEARLRALEKGLKKEGQPAAPVAAPPPEQKPAAEEAAAEEAAAEEAAAEEAAAEEAAAEEAAAEEQSVEEEPEQEGEKTNIVPFVLMGTGGAMVLGSIITGIMASSAQSELEEECPDKMCPPEYDYESTQSSGRTLAVVTDILMFGGIAVAGTGVVLFVLDSMAEQEPASETAAANFGCFGNGCAGSVTVKF